MKCDKKTMLLYAVTDRMWTGKQTLYEQVEAALRGGVTCVQLREKELDEEAFLNEAIEIKELCHKYNVPLIINDNVDVALRSGADGVHVGSEDMAVSEIRKRVPADFIIGVTAKTVEQAKNAERLGADYLGIGAVFPSSTKKNAIRITTEQLKAITGSVSIPTVAIGGIMANNVTEIRGGGMNGIAVVSAIFGAEDIFSATVDLKQKACDVIAENDI